MNNEYDHLTDKALINLVRALAIEVTAYGSDEAELLKSDNITDEELSTIMKANTFLSAFSAVLIQIVERQNPGFAKLVMEVWTSESIQKLAQLAFAEEIANTTTKLQEQIDEIEKFLNK